MEALFPPKYWSHMPGLNLPWSLRQYDSRKHWEKPTALRVTMKIGINVFPRGCFRRNKLLKCPLLWFQPKIDREEHFSGGGLKNKFNENIFICCRRVFVRAVGQTDFFLGRPTVFPKPLKTKSIDCFLSAVLRELFISVEVYGVFTAQCYVRVINWRNIS